MIIQKCKIEDLNSIDKKYIYNYLNNNLNNTFILKVFDNNNLVSIAVCSIPNIEELKKEVDILAENFKNYSDEEQNDEFYIWQDKFIKKLCNGVYLQYITSIQKNKNGAKFIINYIKNNYNKFWLYSAYDVVEFWENKINLSESEQFFYSTERI